MYSFYLLPIIILSIEEQLKIDFEIAIAAIQSGEDAHKFVASATHIANRIEELVVAEVNRSDDTQLKRKLTIAKDTVHKRNIIYTCRILKSKALANCICIYCSILCHVLGATACSYSVVHVILLD